MKRCSAACLLALLFFAAVFYVQAEDGSQGWLRYAPIADTARYATLPSRIVVLGNSPTEQAAATELQRGLTSMLGRTFTVTRETPSNGSAIILTSLATLNKAFTV